MTSNTINTEVTMWDAASVGGAKRFRAGDEILGRYVVESELGQGGMGVVYLCLDKVGGVKVAVKGLPPEVSHNSDEMESVRDNFQLVHELHHSNIAGVLTLEKDTATGDYYLVMAYARGVSLKQWIRQHGGKEHRTEQLNVLRQIASALDYAHNAEPRHIIHRDIKPENVMVDEHGNVFVLDFGLAAQVRSSMSRVSQVVTSRSGTPAYKSPEQWLAQAQRAPSDQYSLGVIAYQMFAGELPYDSDDIEILKHAVVFDLVPPIPGEDKTVNAVFAKVLAKKPADRFASCGDFVAALGGTRSCASAGKTRFSAVLISTLAVGALIGGGWWWRESVKSEEQRVRNEVLAAERTRQAEEAKRAEEARIAAEKAETERKAKIEADRIVAERVAAERKEKEDAERIAAKKLKAEEDAKIAAEKKEEADRAARLEAERKAKAAEEERRKKDEIQRLVNEALAKQKEQETQAKRVSEQKKQVTGLSLAAKKLVGRWQCECQVEYQDSLGSRASDAIKRILPVTSTISLECREDGTVELSDSSGRSFSSSAGTWKYRHGMLIMELKSDDGREFSLSGVVNWRGDAFELHYDNGEYANMIRKSCGNIPNFNVVNSSYVDGRLEVAISTKAPGFMQGKALCSAHVFRRQ